MKGKVKSERDGSDAGGKGGKEGEHGDVESCEKHQGWGGDHHQLQVGGADDETE